MSSIDGSKTGKNLPAKSVEISLISQCIKLATISAIPTAILKKSWMIRMTNISQGWLCMKIEKVEAIAGVCM